MLFERGAFDPEVDFPCSRPFALDSAPAPVACVTVALADALCETASDPPASGPPCETSDFPVDFPVVPLGLGGCWWATDVGTWGWFTTAETGFFVGSVT